MAESSTRVTPTTSRTALPTNKIFYNGRSREARIDPEARVSVVIEMMAAAFGTKEHHITLCLRDEGDHLVTNHNLKHRVLGRVNLKLVPSPMSEALAVVESLKLASQQTSLNDSTMTLALTGSVLALPLDKDKKVLPLKMALFNLQKYIKEADFAVEFMLKGGLKTLVKLLERDVGGMGANSLAYALQGIRGILEYEAAWSDLTDTLIERILHQLIDSPAPNVLRPATAITRKLIISSPHFSGDPSNPRGLATPAKAKSKKNKGKERVPPTATPGVVPEPTEDALQRYGFDSVYARMRAVGDELEGEGEAVERFLRVVVKRLESTGDLELVGQTLGLLNTCLRCADQTGSKEYPDLVTVLENLHLRRYVSRLMPTCVNNIVEPQILHFQSRYAAILNHRRAKAVRPAQNPLQEKMLSEIWHVGRLSHSNDLQSREMIQEAGQTPAGAVDRDWTGWRKIGLVVDDPEAGENGGFPFLIEAELFRDVGELGLECLHWFVMHEDNLHNVLLEQQAKVADRRCPIGKASAECVKLLCEHYKVSQGGHYSPPTFQLFLLNFAKLHQLVLKFFLRMWHESSSTVDDFSRLTFLIRSQIRLSLADEAIKSWLHLERDFLETPYSIIRERQMELLEKEDGMMVRPGIVSLRDKLARDAYEVLREQRIGCMLQGAWFNAATVLVGGVVPSVKPNVARPLRFIRLSPSRRTLAWDDFPARTTSPPVYESLRERIDIANITSIRHETGCAVTSRSPNLTSKYSFSLISGPELSLLDIDAVHVHQFAEWTDGIRALAGDDMEEGMRHKETLDKIRILADVALKVRLLDITGDGVEIPHKVAIGPAPSSVDFWFA